MDITVRYEPTLDSDSGQQAEIDGFLAARRPDDVGN